MSRFYLNHYDLIPINSDEIRLKARGSPVALDGDDPLAREESAGNSLPPATHGAVS